ncbi:MAG TPA: hypothetical protein VKX16_00715 [Chloroflexota bacterium]|nr:hypothetical protein [Chloroflexota bacterium]
MACGERRKRLFYLLVLRCESVERVLHGSSSVPDLPNIIVGRFVVDDGRHPTFERHAAFSSMARVQPTSAEEAAET